MGDQIGTLIVVVLKAKNLTDKHSFFKQDVYAQISLNGKEKKTQVDVKGGQHPVWDEELRYPIYKDKDRTLKLACYSKEPRTDDCIGEGSMDISETLKTGEFDDWVPLQIGSAYRGEIYLEMTYYASGPAPAVLTAPAGLAPAGLTAPTGLNRRPSKLHPDERTRRPAQSPLATPLQKTSNLPGGKTPPSSYAGLAPTTGGGRLAPPRQSGSGTSSPKDPNAALPSVPGPGSLAANVAPQKTEIIPPLLRAGNLSATGKPVHESHPLPPNNPYHAQAPSYTSGSSPAPVLSSPPLAASAYPPASYASPPVLQPGRAGPGPGVGPGARTPPRAHAPYTEPQPAEPLSFPVAMPAFAPSGTPAYPSYPSSGYTSGYGAGPGGGQPNDDILDLPDPFLEQRYHTPLPLPPGVSAHHGTGAGAGVGSSTSSYAGMRSALHDEGPTPRAEVQPSRQPAAPLHLRKDKDKASPARQPQPQSQPPPQHPQSRRDRDAEAAAAIQRLEEDEERRRREQEERDLKLAMELDQEFNARGGDDDDDGIYERMPAAAPAPAAGGMPGGWQR